MRREADSLRDQGRWRGGHRTLMHALGIQHREVFLTAGLAWLLDPDGWHGPGWYWCGYHHRVGLGWGGPEGWNGWRREERREIRRELRREERREYRAY